MVNITYVDLLALASSIPYAQQINSIATTTYDHITFVSYNQCFVDDVLGINATEELIASLPWDAFHEAGAYNIATGKIYVTSNRGENITNSINITTIDVANNDEVGSGRHPDVAQPNGGCAFYPVGSDPTSSEGQQVVFCDQGDMNGNPSQLVLVDPTTNATRVLVNSFFGRNFSSINDVVQHANTGDLWFTDARYSYWQGYSVEPTVRPQVYRFEPNTGVLQAVGDDLIAPNGIEFSPDFKHVYVSDTGTFTNVTDLTNPATIYKYDVTPDGKRLQNRQLFAYSPNGIPDGLHVDTNGNLFAGCGDGIHVWNPSGVAIGKFVVPGTRGVANFAFYPSGIYIFNESKLWKVTIKAEGRTVRRDFGLK